MKNVFLIGDSIRVGTSNGPGYGVFVKELLKDEANVYQPDENCRWAQYTLRYVHQWAEGIDKEAVDVVHWNNGLWDVLRLLGDEPFTPIDIYVEMLRRVHKRLRFLFPNAKIIFATNTPVIEQMAKPDFYRLNSEIDAYNEAACALMKELGAEINDLYALAKTFPDEMHSDFVHFGEEASRLLAEQTAGAIRNALQLQEK